MTRFSLPYHTLLSSLNYSSSSSSSSYSLVLIFPTSTLITSLNLTLARHHILVIQHNAQHNLKMPYSHLTPSTLRPPEQQLRTSAPHLTSISLPRPYKYIDTLTHSHIFVGNYSASPQPVMPRPILPARTPTRTPAPPSPPHMPPLQLV